MRVTIRQALHPYLQSRASQLGIDIAEVVNYLLIQMLLDTSVQSATPNKAEINQVSAPISIAQNEPTLPQEQEHIDPLIARLAGIVDIF